MTFDATQLTPLVVWFDLTWRNTPSHWQVTARLYDAQKRQSGDLRTFPAAFDPQGAIDNAVEELRK